jgi:8-oxo-dGTP pyrophosphatase MutT (NUDIX family)
LQDDLPRKSAPKPPLEVAETCVLAIDPVGRFLVVRRSPGGLWGEFIEFPTVHLSGANPAGRPPGSADDLGRPLLELTGVSLRIGPVVRSLKYGVTKHRVTLVARVAWPIGGEPRPGPGLSAVEWRSPEELIALTRTGATRLLSGWAASNPEALRASSP